MAFFLDTNIPIGYTIIHDKYHENASNFIDNHQDSLFWSDLVEEEYYGRFRNIFRQIRYFLDSVESILETNEKDFEHYLKFENFIINKTSHIPLDEFKKHKIIENFWKDNNFSYANCEEVHAEFLKFNRNFNNVYFKRDKRLNELMNLHNCGKDNYLAYLDYALKLNSWRIHSPDCKILVDAHDCGINHSELIFVSCDEKLFEALDGHDTSFLRIMEFKSCT